LAARLPNRKQMSLLATILLGGLSAWLVLIAIACVLCRAAARSDADDRNAMVSLLRADRRSGALPGTARARFPPAISSNCAEAGHISDAP
jgi:hypothetical protein